MAPDSETFSLSQFLEYMKPEKLAYLIRSGSWVFWSDQSQGVENLGGTLDHGKKIKDMLVEVRFNRWWGCLIQFWAPKRIGNRCFLTTNDQPFALYELTKECCSYRKLCMEKRIDIREEGDDDAEEEEEKELLGPIGRAFRNKLPESSPRVRFYSRQEFSLVDHARNCYYFGAIDAFPVFEIESQTCVGVLEFLGSPVSMNSLDSDILSFERELEVVGLALDHRYLETVPKDQPDSWNEIKEACKVVARTYPLFFALAFIPSAGFWDKDGCGRDFSDSDLLRLAFSETTYNTDFFDEFINAHKASHLEKGKGVSGKAFASLRSCFCRNICDFTITEYPLVHYARIAELKFSFAICLRSTKLEKGLLVLEFFLSVDSSANHYSSLKFLLTIFKEHIQSFEIVAEDVPIEELFPKVRKSSNNDEVDTMGITQHIRDLSELESLQSGRQCEQLDTFCESVPSGSSSPGFHGLGIPCNFPDEFDILGSFRSEGEVDFSEIFRSTGGASDLKGHVDETLPSSSHSSWPDLEVFDNLGCDFSGSEGVPSDIEGLSTGSDVSVSLAENSNRAKRLKQAAGETTHISYDDIKQHFGKPLCEAARCLQVSASTLKRRCRSYGIYRWPRSQKNKGDIQTHSAMQNTDAASQGGQWSISFPGTSSFLNLSSQEYVHSVGPVTPNIGSSIQNFGIVTIKVSYKECMKIRFRLCSTATLAALEEEVAKRLEINVGSFRTTYYDDEDDFITITCDEDLQHCMEVMTSNGSSTTIKMAVQLKPN